MSGKWDPKIRRTWTPPGSIKVAVNGSVNLSHRCLLCGAAMLYRIGSDNGVEAIFCGNENCHAFLLARKEDGRE